MEQRPNRAKNVPKQRRLRHASWVALTLLLLLLLLPYLLVPLYRVVNPVSTLMLWRWAHGMRVERTFMQSMEVLQVLRSDPVQLTNFDSQEDKELAFRFIDSLKEILERRGIRNRDKEYNESDVHTVSPEM